MSSAQHSSCFISVRWIQLLCAGSSICDVLGFHVNHSLLNRRSMNIPLRLKQNSIIIYGKTLTNIICHFWHCTIKAKAIMLFIYLCFFKLTTANKMKYMVDCLCIRTECTCVAFNLGHSIIPFTGIQSKINLKLAPHIKIALMHAIWMCEIVVLLNYIQDSQILELYGTV